MNELRLKDFIDNDLKVFSNLDNVRSIPSLIDGFKDSQRKAVYGLIENGLSEIKVAQLSGIAALKTAYAHGENSMCETIVGLAQKFPGSNNVNLFEPIGQFGSILSSSAASPRYIYTKPSANLRKYLKKDDDLILEHRYEEGDKLEPVNYLPLIPMWLVNGSVGIGTGHSVKILSRDPKLVLNLVEKMVNGVNVQQKTIDAAMAPNFNGWKGTVSKGESDTQWELTGVIEKINSTTLRVTELPVFYGVDKFKSILIDLMDKGTVKDFDNNSKETGFDFVITVPREVAKKDLKDLINIFKLSVRIGENVTLWSPNGNLKKFDNVYEALKEFVEYRVNKYNDRKVAQLKEMEEELVWLDNKARFIQFWNTKLVDPHKKTKDQMYKELEEGNILPEFFDRLLSMQISSLTMDKVKELVEQIDELKKKKQELEGTSPEAIYSKEIASI